VAPGCLLAGWWQYRVALAGNSLSWAYTIEWPCFSVIAVVAWWHLIHEDPAERDARAEKARADEETRLGLARSLEALTTGTPSAADDPPLERTAQEYAERIAAAARKEYQSHLDRQAHNDDHGGSGLRPASR